MLAVQVRGTVDEKQTIAKCCMLNAIQSTLYVDYILT